ncbi:MAG: adenine phosphoribosyltransferase [Candidatus Omnitrophica bacterium]|nr:adenine phosphoribosyltransferase [Candidatus Omnitrophota bacterium]
MTDEAVVREFKTLIRDVADFPKPGILFKDITPLLADAAAFADAVDAMIAPFAGIAVQKVAGVESRGFIFATAVAMKLRLPLIPIRKKGKLPYKTREVTYDLEYGQDTLAVHEDAAREGEQVLIVDDLLATGGTVGATAELVKSLGAHVAGLSFLIELEFLGGRSRFDGVPIHSVLRY